MLKKPVSDQLGSVAHTFIFQIPDDTFVDDDGKSTLTYSATLDNGDPLPQWLTFNSDSRKFIGTPIDNKNYRIKVTATDNAKAVAITTFNLGINN